MVGWEWVRLSCVFELFTWTVSKVFNCSVDGSRSKGGWGGLSLSELGIREAEGYENVAAGIGAYFLRTHHSLDFTASPREEGRNLKSLLVRLAYQCPGKRLWGAGPAGAASSRALLTAASHSARTLSTLASAAEEALPVVCSVFGLQVCELNSHSLRHNF